MAWKGEGNVGGTISLALLNYDKAIGPGEAIKIDTDLPGSTLLFEILSIDAPSMLVVQGGWGNLTISGKAKIDAIGVVKIKQSFSLNIFEATPITTCVALSNILN